MAAPILDDADEGGANQHHLGVEAVLLSLTGKTGEDAAFVKGVLESYVVLGGGGVAAMHSGDEVDRTVMMLLAGDGAGGDVGGGGENTLDGLVDTSGMEGVLDLGGAGVEDGLVDASLLDEPGDATAGVDAKVGDMLLIALVSRLLTFLSTLEPSRHSLTSFLPFPRSDLSTLDVDSSHLPSSPHSTRPFASSVPTNPSPLTLHFHPRFHRRWILDSNFWPLHCSSTAFPPFCLNFLLTSPFLTLNSFHQSSSPSLFPKVTRPGFSDPSSPHLPRHLSPSTRSTLSRTPNEQPNDDLRFLRATTMALMPWI